MKDEDIDNYGIDFEEVNDKLGRIESKLDSLLELWAKKSCELKKCLQQNEGKKPR